MGVPIHVDHPEKAPTQPHYAIFKFFTANTSTYDMNDGSVSGIRYEAYLTKADWIAEIEHLEKDRGHDREKYVAVKVSAPAKPTLRVEVDVKEP
jgi:hypothetical protein